MDELLLLDPIAPPRRYGIEYWAVPNWLGPRLRIFVDGVEQREVIEYDCDAGTVLKNKLGEDGRLMLNEKRDEVAREIVRGAVTVELKDAD